LEAENDLAAWEVVRDARLKSTPARKEDSFIILGRADVTTMHSNVKK
jgi:hypothetical protein